MNKKSYGTLEVPGAAEAPKPEVRVTSKRQDLLAVFMAAAATAAVPAIAVWAEPALMSGFRVMAIFVGLMLGAWLAMTISPKKVYSDVFGMAFFGVLFLGAIALLGGLVKLVEAL